MDQQIVGALTQQDITLLLKQLEASRPKLQVAAEEVDMLYVAPRDRKQIKAVVKRVDEICNMLRRLQKLPSLVEKAAVYIVEGPYTMTSKSAAFLRSAFIVGKSPARLLSDELYHIDKWGVRHFRYYHMGNMDSLLRFHLEVKRRGEIPDDKSRLLKAIYVEVENTYGITKALNVLARWELIDPSLIPYIGDIEDAPPIPQYVRERRTKRARLAQKRGRSVRYQRSQ